MKKILLILAILTLSACCCERTSYHCNTEAQERIQKWLLECYKVSPNHLKGRCDYNAKEIFCKRLTEK